MRATSSEPQRNSPPQLGVLRKDLVVSDLLRLAARTAMASLLVLSSLAHGQHALLAAPARASLTLSMQGQLARQAASPSSRTLNTGPCRDEETRISELRRKRRELLLRYTEQHPDIIALERRIAHLRKGIASATCRRGPSTITSAPASRIADKKSAWHRPKRLNANGLILVDGAPFFPIGLYNVPIGALKRAKALGFNTVQTYAGEGRAEKPNSSSSIEQMKRYITRADKLGLKVLMGLPRHQIISQRYKALEERIELLRDSKGLLAWYLYDEPDCARIPVVRIAVLSRLVQRLDKANPQVLALCMTRTAPNYSHIPDILMPFRYPIRGHSSSPEPVWQAVSEAAAWQNSERPVWTVIQAHGKGPGGKGYGLTEPNYAELRNMTFLAVAAGAKGLMYFTYRGSQFRLEGSRNGLQNILRITWQLRRAMPMLLAERRSRVSGLTVSENAQVRTAFFLTAKATRVLLVNVSRSEQIVRISTHHTARPEQIVDFFDDRQLILVGDQIIVTLPPLGVRLLSLLKHSSSLPLRGSHSSKGS